MTELFKFIYFYLLPLGGALVFIFFFLHDLSKKNKSTWTLIAIIICTLFISYLGNKHISDAKVTIKKSQQSLTDSMIVLEKRLVASQDSIKKQLDEVMRKLNSE